jgi:hypothetical protein
VKGKDVPKSMLENMERWADRRWFFVPVNDRGEGVVLPILDGESAYDFGSEGNWESICGKGWGWLLPWNVLLGRRGTDLDIMNWPLAPIVQRRLHDEALRISEERHAVHDD